MLKELHSQGQLDVSIRLGPHDSRSYVICGEVALLSLIISINGSQATFSPEHAQYASARLEELTVELDELPNSRLSSISSLHRMRSVESLTSLRSEITSSSSSVSGPEPLTNDDYQASRAKFIDEKTLAIQIKTLIDSEASFSKARVRLKVSLFEDHPDETLRTFLKQKKLGASLIRNLLEGDSALGRVDYEFVTDFVAFAGLTIPVYRPFEAAIRFARSLPSDPILVGSTLSVSPIPRETFKVNSIKMTIGDPDTRVSRRMEEFDLQVLRIVPFAVPTPCILSSKSTYNCIHQIDIMPFAEQHLQGSELAARMDVAISIVGEEEDSALIVSFERTFKFQELLPNRSSPHGLNITLTVLQDPVVVNNPCRIQVDVANRTDLDRDLYLSFPLPSVEDGHTMERRGNPIKESLSNDPFVTNEHFVDIHYAELDRRSRPFIPLQRELSFGSVAAGSCNSGFIDILPLATGPQWIPKMIVADRLRGEKFEVPRPLEILVLQGTLENKAA